jgi:hypothetical protein
VAARTLGNVGLMISIFSMISAFLIWHNWQTSGSFSPQAALGHQHNPLCCFQMTQFSSIIAQVPLPLPISGLPNDTNRLSDGHQNAISEPKLKLLLGLEKRDQQGWSVDQPISLLQWADFWG